MRTLNFNNCSSFSSGSDSLSSHSTIDDSSMRTNTPGCDSMLASKHAMDRDPLNSAGADADAGKMPAESPAVPDEPAQADYQSSQAQSQRLVEGDGSLAEATLRYLQRAPKEYRRVLAGDCDRYLVIEMLRIRIEDLKTEKKQAQDSREFYEGMCNCMEREIDHVREMNQLRERDYKRQVARLTDKSKELESTCDRLRSRLEDARSENLAHINAKAAALAALESERAESRMRSYSMGSTDAWTMTEPIESKPEINDTSNDLAAQTVSGGPKISHNQVLECSEPLRSDIMAAPLMPTPTPTLVPIFLRHYTEDTLVDQTAETATPEATSTKTAPATKPRAAKAVKAVKTAAAKAKAAAKTAKAAMAYIRLRRYH
ncbi:hypothetical protein GGI11_007696 [Coemansia sp. RSA 2049]|nr:hypothetical protein GGI11_007696 [Coemansia sp. RSA 2049]